MATELAKAYVQIVPSAQGLGSSLESMMNGESASAGESAGNAFGANMIGTVKNLVAAAGIGAVFKAAIDEGANLQQSIGGVETLYEGAAGAIKGYANEAYKYGLTANDYMEQSTSFAAALKGSLGGDVTAAAEAANTALEDMADNSAKLGTPIESLQTAYQGFAKQNYTMLDNLKLGYGGTKSEMERLLADAQKISGVEYNLDNLADVYSAIHVIQEDLNLTGVAASEAKTTFSGSFAAMQAAAQNLLGSIAIGDDISDELTAVVDTASTFLFENFIPMVGNILLQIPTLITEGAPIVIEAIKGMIGQMSEAIIGYDITSDLSSFGDGIIEFLSTIAPEFFSQGMYWVANTAMGIIESVPGLIENAGFIIDSILAGLEEGLPQMLDKGIQVIEQIATGILENAPTVISSMGEITTNLISFLMEHMPEYLEKGVELLQHIGQGILENGPEILTTMGKVLVDIIGTIAENLPEFLAKGVDLLVELGKGLIQGIPDLLGKLPEIFDSILDEFGKFDWASIGSNIINGIIDGIKGIASNLGGAVIGAVSDAWDGLVSWLDIRSPSHKAENVIGKNWALGIGVGFEKNMPEEEMTLSTKRTMDAISGTIDRPMSSYQAIDRGDNADVVAAISELKQAILSMRMVMDSGETVAIVDQGLGREAMRAAWQ